MEICSKAMINPIFRRFHHSSRPVVSLTEGQDDALARFSTKLDHNFYTFEKADCLCGTQNGKLIARHDRYGLPVNTYLCRSCGIMRTNPRMTESSLREFYNEDYRAIYVSTAQTPEDFFTDQIRSGETIYEFVAPNILFKEKLMVFDVGCGSGGSLVPFLNSGWTGFGCDLGSDYLRVGQAAGLTLEHGDISDLRKYGNAHLVILSHVLEHLPNPERSLEAISDSLVAGGYVYIELPGIFRIHKTYGDTLMFLQNAHLFHFTLATLTSMMTRAGFRLVKGNEKIRALYQMSDAPNFVQTKGIYSKIVAYLYFTELNRAVFRRIPFFSHISHMENRMIAKSILGDVLVDSMKRRISGL